MIYKLLMSVYKEFLVLRRDVGGVVILFVMPLVLIITVTLIQDSKFREVNESRIPILLVDNDKGEVSQEVTENLEKSALFSIIRTIHQDTLTEEMAKEAVFKGRYQLAIVLPKSLTADLQTKINLNVQKIMSRMGLADTLANSALTPIEQKEVRLYFDPATQLSFKSAVMNTIDKMISQIETKSIYTTFQIQFGDDELQFNEQSFIAFTEILPKSGEQEVLPNTVQHNVPAWTLFAIFFIVIPLSINIVKEKTQGTFIRLRTNPVPSSIVLIGKTITYLFICMVQFYLMVAVAIYLFPHLGLPSLNVSGNLILLSVVALFVGLAAIGYGILLGTLAKTQEQSAPFGATSVIILAAIGGVWVPVFLMPPFMQVVAKASPMNWGLEAFYDILLRNGSLFDILPELALLSLFFVVLVGISLIYDKKKRAV